MFRISINVFEGEKVQLGGRGFQFEKTSDHGLQPGDGWKYHWIAKYLTKGFRDIISIFAMCWLDLRSIPFLLLLIDLQLNNNNPYMCET